MLLNFWLTENFSKGSILLNLDYATLAISSEDFDFFITFTKSCTFSNFFVSSSSINFKRSFNKFISSSYFFELINNSFSNSSIKCLVSSIFKF